MGCRGVHFSLDGRTATALKAIGDEHERLQFIQEQIEEDYFKYHPEWLAESDKSWDWIHRVLTDGKLEWNNGTYPLNHVVMGGESLYSESDYMSTSARVSSSGCRPRLSTARSTAVL